MYQYLLFLYLNLFHSYYLQYLLDNYPEFEVVSVDAYEGFRKGHPEWILNGSEELKHTFRLWPQHIKGEGHFVALLHKKGEPKKGKETGTKKLPKFPKGTEDFFSQVNLDLEGKHFEEFGEKVYLVPDILPDLRGLRILRTGLYLGEKKKNRFEPSQSLAMALKAGDYPHTLNYACDSLDLKKYLKGETIELENDKYEGLSQTKEIENGAAKRLEVDCSMGSVNIGFTK